MSLIGTEFQALVTDENDRAYFVQKEGKTFQLDKSEGEHQIGEMVEGFAYTGPKEQAWFTTKLPKSRPGHFAFGTVVGSRRDLGIFVDIELPNKEIVVSLDDLPTMRELWPQKGDQVMVSLKVDAKERMWGILADEPIFTSLSRKATVETHKNANVKGIAYRLKLAGTYILTDDYYIGFIHPNERVKEPRLGQEVSGRVIGVRPDGVLNVSLKPRAHEVIGEDAEMILAVLRRSANQRIPYTDKSTPEEIQQAFAISKGQFKRAIGNLLKARKIKQENGETILLPEAN